MKSSPRFKSSGIWRFSLERAEPVSQWGSSMHWRWVNWWETKKNICSYFLNHLLPCVKHFKTASCENQANTKENLVERGTWNSPGAPYKTNGVNEQTLDYPCSHTLNIRCNEWLFSMPGTLAIMCLLKIWPCYHWCGSNTLPANFFKGHEVQEMLRMN